MTRTFMTATLAALAFAAAIPAAAQARTACPNETVTPTAANSARVSDAIFCLSDQIRSSYGLAPFRRDARLDAAARLHSEDMAGRDYFAHDTPEGLTPQDRAGAQGYTDGVGENIAAGYRNARAVVLGWMASAGHCRNILGQARDIGVGTAATPRANYTQDFGSYTFGPQSQASAGCPYTVNLDTLDVPEQAPPPPSPAAPVAAVVAPVLQAIEQVAGPAEVAAVTPVLDSLRITPTLPTRGRRGVIAYTLSQPATTTFRIERRMTNGRYRTLAGKLTDEGVEGANELAFSGSLHGRRLAAGRYRLRAVATDETGSASAPKRARFRIVRR
ncbi:MAG TPA: CAP domain-containing protein [Solirubrobacteraceae bacterium]|nr:CAP domain-containing protein [Solirubrobacteraceae bacterium]